MTAQQRHREWLEELRADREGVGAWLRWQACGRDPRLRRQWLTKLMVIDSSALLAILQNGPERHAFNEVIAAASQRLLSAASLVVLSIVIGARYGSDELVELDCLLNIAEIQIVSLDRAQAELARLAFAQFGKGRHRASLNIGDCFSYALAKWFDQPLLFKGDDFSYTDLVAAAAPLTQL